MRSWMLWMVVVGCAGGVVTVDSDTDVDVEDPETPYTWLDEADAGPPCPRFDEGPWFYDSDTDGFGQHGHPRPCWEPGMLTNDDDCGDTDPDVHPGAEEILCNGKDDDCDASTPEAPPAPSPKELWVGDETFERLEDALAGRSGEVEVRIGSSDWDFTEVDVPPEVTHLKLNGGACSNRGARIVVPDEGSSKFPATNAGSLTLENLSVGYYEERPVPEPNFGGTADLTVLNVDFWRSFSASTTGGSIRVERTEVVSPMRTRPEVYRFGDARLSAHDLTVRSSRLNATLTATGNLVLHDLTGEVLEAETVPSADGIPPPPFDIQEIVYESELDPGRVTISGQGRLRDLTADSLTLRINGPSDIQGLRDDPVWAHDTTWILEYAPSTDEPLEIRDVGLTPNTYANRITAHAPLTLVNLRVSGASRFSLSLDGTAPIHWIGGTVWDNYAIPDGLIDVRTDVTIEDVSVYRNMGRSEGSECVYSIEGGTLTLDDVNVGFGEYGANSIPEVGGMDDADEPTWDAYGRVWAFCDESGCVSLE